MNINERHIELKEIHNEIISQGQVKNEIEELISIYKKNRKVTIYKIYSKTKNLELSEDIYQESFIRAQSAIYRGSYKRNSNMGGWFYTVCMNHTIDVLRKIDKEPCKPKKREDEGRDYLHILKAEEIEEEGIINKENIDKLREHIERSPNNLKRVLKRRIYDEKSFKEIAKEDNISINTALGRMRYATIKLKEIFHLD